MSKKRTLKQIVDDIDKYEALYEEDLLEYLRILRDKESKKED